MKYKAQMEGYLTASLRRREPLLSEVHISDKGEFAVIHVAGKCTRQRLTQFGKTFLRTGSVDAFVGDDLLENTFWRLALEDEVLPCE